MKDLALFAKTYYNKEKESVRRNEMCEVVNMDMMTVQQVAEKWGVSVRYVQVLCKKGKLPGAVKFGLNWMIPADAERPKDGRYKENKAESNTAPKIIMPVQSPLMTLSPFYNKPGGADKCIELLAATPETQKLFSGELAFLQGDIPKALEIVFPLLDVDTDFYGALNVGMFLSALGIWQNDNILWKKGRERMASAPCSNDTESRIRDLWLKINDGTIYENRQNLAPSSWNEFNKLPADSVPAYLFYFAKHMHKLGVAVAREEVELSDIQRMGVLRMFPYLGEPLIAQVHDCGSVLSEIYLHFLCADAYNKIGAKEKSEQHLEIAVSLCLPDKLYGVLAECRGLMGTFLDECLERKDAEAAKKVRKLEKQIYTNWMEMVNQTADIGLSDRQKEIARLASIGLSNEEIADHLQISYNTVKSTITMIMNKTGTSKRSEFAPYIF